MDQERRHREVPTVVKMSVDAVLVSDDSRCIGFFSRMFAHGLLRSCRAGIFARL